MSEIEGIEQIGHAAAAIQIQGPEREPDAFELPDGEVLEVNAIGGTANLERVREREPDMVRTVAITEDDRIGTGIPPLTPPGDAPALFDGKAYVAVPEIDGQTADRLVIAFSGSVAYDAADPEGAALYDTLRLGKAVELRVAGFVSAKQGGYKVTARDEEVVTGKATIRVDSLYVLTPEAL